MDLLASIVGGDSNRKHIVGKTWAELKINVAVSFVIVKGEAFQDEGGWCIFSYDRIMGMIYCLVWAIG